MNAASWLTLAAVGAAFCFALRAWRRSSDCGYCRDCDGCRQRDEKRFGR
ncbi:MAG: hypothetical protein SOV63_03245 [Pyramidobacter porci]|nr:hypothetical protein [Pyramidobacter porci]MDY2647803.1 hypothetical protein [Pyramidobacter porci]